LEVLVDQHVLPSGKLDKGTFHRALQRHGAQPRTFAVGTAHVFNPMVDAEVAEGYYSGNDDDDDDDDDDSLAQDSHTASLIEQSGISDSELEVLVDQHVLPSGKLDKDTFHRALQRHGAQPRTYVVVDAKDTSKGGMEGYYSSNDGDYDDYDDYDDDDDDDSLAKDSHTASLIEQSGISDSELEVLVDQHVLPSGKLDKGRFHEALKRQNKVETVKEF
jgi:hypothetical protein